MLWNKTSYKAMHVLGLRHDVLKQEDYPLQVIWSSKDIKCILKNRNVTCKIFTELFIIWRVCEFKTSVMSVGLVNAHK